jgi:hypothetical protein
MEGDEMMERKFVNVDELLKRKPGNEGEVHFVLKHVAKAWVWGALKCRVVGSEIYGLWSSDAKVSDNGRVMIQGKKLKTLLNKVCPYCFSSLNVQSGYMGVERLMCGGDGVYENGAWGCRRSFIKSDDGWWTRKRRPNSTRSIIDVLGVGKRVVQNASTGHRRTEMWVTRGIEVKASLSDFRSGFCQGADFTYVMAPKGVVPLSEVPKGVGLVEVDVERVRVQIEPVIGVVGAVVAKKSTFMMDSRFKTLDAHQKYVTDLIARIAARNTIENMRGLL